jgi:mono/diheme cytochrome c family protein
MKSTLFGIGLLATLAAPAVAQDSTKQTPRSTLTGVFTIEQASRGKNVFLGSCKSCHAPESHVGANFQRLWVGKPLLALFKYVSEGMPENDPGSLGAEANADVVAYLLQLNGMPTGTSELAPDSTVMRSILVEPKPAVSPPHHLTRLTSGRVRR